MSVEITWKIDALECKPAVGNLKDYVVTAHYRCNGTDGTFNGSVYNNVQFPIDEANPGYTPFDQLTEAQVVGWTKSTLGEFYVAAIEAAVAKQIEDQITPPIVSPALPWASTAEVSA